MSFDAGAVGEVDRVLDEITAAKVLFVAAIVEHVPQSSLVSVVETKLGFFAVGYAVSCDAGAVVDVHRLSPRRTRR